MGSDGNPMSLRRGWNWGRVIYPVAEIFRTLQGEGHFVGFPAIFVRLAGCSLWGKGLCHIAKECDTEPTRVAERLEAPAIVARCRELDFINKPGIVVLTGGEPTDYDLLPLIEALMVAGYRVHLETSGEYPVTGYPLEWITVSPKTPTYAQRVGHTLKVVVRPEWNWLDVLRFDEDANFFHRYLQPLTGEDGKPVNMGHVIDMLQGVTNKNARWALSTQAHRAWGLR